MGVPKPYFTFSCRSHEWQSHPKGLLLPLLFLHVYFVPGGKEAKLKVAAFPPSVLIARR